MSEITELRKKYLRYNIARVEIPAFKESPIARKNFIFSGKVQKVGFRVEVYGMASRLDLVGWVKNRKDKRVEAEIQGEKEKIDFLIKYLNSIRRAPVDKIEIQELGLREDESEFRVIE